jgi:hypothetical protein
MAKELIVIMGSGAFILFVGFLNVQNFRHARKNGIIFKTGWELGPSSYERIRNPFQYWLHYWGSLIAAIVCCMLGIALIGMGIYLAGFMLG